MSWPAAKTPESSARPRSQHWHWLTGSLGLVLLLPIGGVQETSALLQETLLSTVPWVHVPALLAQDARGATGSFQPLDWVAEELRRSESQVLPPPDWRSPGGEFCRVPIGAQRSDSELSLALVGPAPHRQPALLGEQLVGITWQEEGRAARLLPITASGQRFRACAGEQDSGRQITFIAAGDGSDTLRVEVPEKRFALRPGDAVWCSGELESGWQPPAGQHLLLGHLEEAAGVPATDRPHWRVRPGFRSEQLDQVAVHFPEGLARPSERDLVPRRVVAVPRGLVLEGRSGLLILRGREDGVERGMCVAAGASLVGLVERVGFGCSLVRCLDDPGYRMRTLILSPGGCKPWELASKGAEGTDVQLEEAPPPGTVTESTVVTGVSARWIPAGLFIGQLVARGEEWVLRRPEAGAESYFLFLPNEEGAP